MTTLSLIAALARNGVIGRDNALPWHLPADLAHFKRATMGCPVIMGRLTHESIGRPLPGRLNIVVSRQAQWSAAGVSHAHDLDEALAMVAQAPKAFVIGGAQLYASALARADELVLTEIDAEVAGDAHFPAWPREAFDECERISHPAQGDTLGYAFVTYRRKPAPF